MVELKTSLSMGCCRPIAERLATSMAFESVWTCASSSRTRLRDGLDLASALARPVLRVRQSLLSQANTPGIVQIDTERNPPKERGARLHGVVSVGVHICSVASRRDLALERSDLRPEHCTRIGSDRDEQVRRQRGT